MNTQLINKKDILKLSVAEIDTLIAQLEEAAHSLLFFQDDKKKFFNLRNMIGYLIDVRCKKAGIVIPKHLR
jgi:hypothetical protein